MSAPAADQDRAHDKARTARQHQIKGILDSKAQVTGGQSRHQRQQRDQERSGERCLNDDAGQQPVLGDGLPSSLHLNAEPGAHRLLRQGWACLLVILRKTKDQKESK